MVTGYFQHRLVYSPFDFLALSYQIFPSSSGAQLRNPNQRYA